MNKTETKCKYCGKAIKNNAGDICHNCLNKLPLVRKLCAIGRAIKRGTKK